LIIGKRNIKIPKSKIENLQWPAILEAGFAFP
jgi:hypothetical protein